MGEMEPSMMGYRGSIVPRCSDSSGRARCSNCGRFLGSPEDLNKHHEYCSYFLLKKKEAEEAGVPLEEAVDEPWLDGLTIEYLAWTYAYTCLSYLNKQEGREYKLVKPGNFSMVGIAGGLLIHFNFKAKEKGSPAETFFAQLRSSSCSGQEVDFCLSLGNSENLPSWHYADLEGCHYCSFGVHHPSPRCNSKLIMKDKILDKILDTLKFDPRYKSVLPSCSDTN